MTLELTSEELTTLHIALMFTAQRIRDNRPDLFYSLANKVIAAVKADDDAAKRAGWDTKNKAY